MRYKLISKGINPPKVLFNSGTNTVKIFDTVEEANRMKDELNDITLDDVHWEVAPLNAEGNPQE
ncbi:hypothetical protein [Lentibacillus sediminis]|uniref:hypothetical protein n=1 Tax=Lentibacillus sediminis TaxID=1940529 RepID=UPI000C1C7EBC|nr:hypothetical protein [Lentibacillus sediminis]